MECQWLSHVQGSYWELCSAVLAASGDSVRSQSFSKIRCTTTLRWDARAVSPKLMLSKLPNWLGAQFSRFYGDLRWYNMMHTFTWTYIMLAYVSVILPFRRSRRSAYRSSIMKIMNIFGKVKHLTVDRLCWSSCHIKSMVNDSQVLKHADLLLSWCEASAHDFIMSFPMGYQTKAWLQEKKVASCMSSHVIVAISLPQLPSWRLPGAFRAPSLLEAGMPGWTSRHPAEWWSEAAFGHCTGADTKARHWEAPSSSGWEGSLWDTVGYRGSQRVLTWERRRFRMHHMLRQGSPVAGWGGMAQNGTEWRRMAQIPAVPGCASHFRSWSFCESCWHPKSP